MKPAGEWKVPGLVTAGEIASRIGVSPERLIELAQLGYAPHVVIDGRGQPWFHPKTTVDWAKENLWRTSGGTAFPTELTVVTTGEVIDRPPAALTALVSLRQFKDPQAGQPCVYFLVDGDEIVYVGQSVRLWQRIAAHKADDDKIFARVYYVAVPHERLATVEAAFIKHFRPRHNTTGITRSEAAIEAERGWVESVVRQYLPGHGAT